MSYLGILGCMFEKVLSYFQNSRISQNAKFPGKLKPLILGPNIFDLGVFRLQF